MEAVQIKEGYMDQQKAQGTTEALDQLLSGVYPAQKSETKAIDELL